MARLASLCRQLLISLCYLVLLQAAKPFKSPTTSFFAVFTNLSLCLTLLAALIVIVIDVDFHRAQETLAGSALLHASELFGFKEAFPLTFIILCVNFVRAAGFNRRK